MHSSTSANTAFFRRPEIEGARIWTRAILWISWLTAKLFRYFQHKSQAMGSHKSWSASAILMRRKWPITWIKKSSGNFGWWSSQHFLAKNCSSYRNQLWSRKKLRQLEILDVFFSLFLIPGDKKWQKSCFLFHLQPFLSFCRQGSRCQCDQPWKKVRQRNFKILPN